MKILKPLALLFVLFLYATPSLAVTFFYRADDRPFEEILASDPAGFNSWGVNDDLVRHVEGEILGEPEPESSAFIATTSDFDQAVAIAQIGIVATDSHAPRMPFYIYAIRPTDNFYSVELSFRHFQQQTGNPVFGELLEDYGEQREYAAYRHIPIVQIRQVMTYEYNSEMRRYVRTRTISNNAYVEAETEPNHGPYPHFNLPDPAGYSMSEHNCVINFNNSSSVLSFVSRSLAKNDDYQSAIIKWRRCHIMLETTSIISMMLF
ncbi:hypothetical protein; putative exported protein [Xenorhabdus nematophila ATCC 19061]|uniref:Pertussis toxin subunit 1 n=1 Tax=Xenorhabdus nematophila (strain ATCC 19061 / DSM 3370 / CCUG 14189 / LMG 1036 / NCIMB 9965 / AN6) TaxID=406817 RepID=D3VKJ5_XENNA|nr:enterotoxin A family protein [Xenorhabdus nematophila]CBJ88947.1 hypothetical protein; putative exported protein [Xenorhabdus nematophila ATCC 19061]CEK21856.1 hypothetical protein; putative exported protein [Xenorhabdus nematophila AN6/1]